MPLRWRGAEASVVRVHVLRHPSCLLTQILLTNVTYRNHPPTLHETLYPFPSGPERLSCEMTERSFRYTNVHQRILHTAIDTRHSQHRRLVVPYQHEKQLAYSVEPAQRA